MVAPSVGAPAEQSAVSARRGWLATWELAQVLSLCLCGTVEEGKEEAEAP
jgi:hypothetical protein